MLCDFCNDPNPVWRYPTSDFEATEVSVSIGGWAACDACHRLIEAGLWKRLAERGVSRFFDSFKGDVVPDLDFNRSTVFEEMVQLHQRFATSRKGPATKL